MLFTDILEKREVKSFTEQKTMYGMVYGQSESKDRKVMDRHNE